MARRPNDFWRERVKELTVNNDASGVRFGPESVLSALMAHYEGLTEADQRKYGKPPSKATIGRIQHEVRGMPKEKREQYLWFYWPESMERDLLPWEASRPLLHLLAQDLWLGVRPQIPVCRWYWKLYQAAPDCPHAGLENVARMLATREMQGPIPDYKLRAVEGYLAYRGWLPPAAPIIPKGEFIETAGASVEDMAAKRKEFETLFQPPSLPSYERAVKMRTVLPLYIDFEEPAESNLDDMTSRRVMFTPIREEVARHESQIDAAARADRERRGKEEWAKFKEQRRISGRPLSPGFLQESPQDLEEWVKFQEEQRHISEGVMSPEVEQEKEDTNGEAQG